jgi:hypothetical protein
VIKNLNCKINPVESIFYWVKIIQMVVGLGMFTATFGSGASTFINKKFKEEKDEAKEWIDNKIKWAENEILN